RGPEKAQLLLHRRRGGSEPARVAQLGPRRLQRRRRLASRGARGDPPARKSARRPRAADLRAASAGRSAADAGRELPHARRLRIRARRAHRSGPDARGAVGADALCRGRRVSRVGLSVVIPVYDEAGSLPELHAELVGALDALGRSWEILYLDDGSRDGSDRAIAAL